MYSGTNPKALNSQRLLADALVSLIKEKDYYQISVFDICQSASLSRQTFYNFFNSKEEILYFFFKEQFSDNDKQNLSDTLEYYSDVLRRNKILMQKMFEFSLEGIATGEISKSLFRISDNFFEGTDQPHLYLYKRTLFSGAVAHLLIEWFRTNMAAPLSELTLLIENTFGISDTLYIYNPSEEKEDEVYYDDSNKEEYTYTESSEEEQYEQQPIPLFLL